MHRFMCPNWSARPFQTIHAPRHRFKNPFTMSNVGGKPAYSLLPNCFGKRDPFSFHPGVSNASGGAYRDRTDDPLLAKQVLSQLS